VRPVSFPPIAPGICHAGRAFARVSVTRRRLGRAGRRIGGRGSGARRKNGSPGHAPVAALVARKAADEAVGFGHGRGWRSAQAAGTGRPNNYGGNEPKTRARMARRAGSPRASPQRLSSFRSDLWGKKNGRPERPIRPQTTMGRRHKCCTVAATRAIECPDRGHRPKALSDFSVAGEAGRAGPSATVGREGNAL